MFCWRNEPSRTFAHSSTNCSTMNVSVLKSSSGKVCPAMHNLMTSCTVFLPHVFISQHSKLTWSKWKLLPPHHQVSTFFKKHVVIKNTGRRILKYCASKSACNQPFVHYFLVNLCHSVFDWQMTWLTWHALGPSNGGACLNIKKISQIREIKIWLPKLQTW